VDEVIPYISGMWTLPWIVVGFFVTLALSSIFGEEKINRIMKKAGLVILFIFIPILVFKLFLNTNFGEEEMDFVILSLAVMAFLYLIAYLYARKRIKICRDDGERTTFMKTIIVNQGRSAAFVGGAMLAIEKWAVYAAIYITLLGIFLFALVPYVLSVIHQREVKSGKKEHSPLPLYLRIYPWYLIVFPISAVIIHMQTGITTASFEWGKLLNLLAAVTIPAALYYVGAGIKVRDLKKEAVKELFYGKEHREARWVREILLLTIIVTPLVIALLFGSLLFLHIIPSEWFAVLILNAVLPITSTNMFLIPYGIDGKVTALAVTWSTIISIPLFVVLLNLLSYLL